MLGFFYNYFLEYGLFYLISKKSAAKVIKSLIWHSFYDKSFSQAVRYEVFIL